MLSRLIVQRLPKNFGVIRRFKSTKTTQTTRTTDGIDKLRAGYYQVFIGTKDLAQGAFKYIKEKPPLHLYAGVIAVSAAGGTFIGTCMGTNKAFKDLFERDWHYYNNFDKTMWIVGTTVEYTVGGLFAGLLAGAVSPLTPIIAPMYLHNRYKYKNTKCDC